MIFDEEKDFFWNGINIYITCALSLYEEEKRKRDNFFTAFLRKLNDVSGIVCTIHGTALDIFR